MITTFPRKDITLEYILNRHTPHAFVTSVMEMEDHYEARVKMRWYSALTFGILQSRTEREIVEIWYQLDVKPSALNIIFEG